MIAVNQNPAKYFARQTKTIRINNSILNNSPKTFHLDIVGIMDY